MARRVFILCDNFGKVGGTQSAASALAEGLCRIGQEVVLVGIHPWRHSPVEYWSANPSGRWFETPPLAHLRPGAFGWRVKVKTVLARSHAPSVRRRLHSFFRKFTNDDVVVFFTPELQSAYWRWRESGVRAEPTVVTQLHSSFDGICQQGYLEEYREFAPRADYVLSLDCDSAERFRNEFGTECGFLPNCLPLHASALPGSAESRPKSIVVVTRFAPEKRVDRIVEAFAEVADKHKDWSMDIFGIGMSEASIREQVKVSGVESRVRLHGPTSDAISAFQSGSLSVLSSLYEGLPMSLLEAAACGVPTVATRCASSSVEEFASRYGFFVEDDSVEGLANGLDLAMADERERVSVGGRAYRFAQTRAADRVALAWMRMIDDASLPQGLA